MQHSLYTVFPTRARERERDIYVSPSSQKMNTTGRSLEPDTETKSVTKQAHMHTAGWVVTSLSESTLQCIDMNRPSHYSMFKAQHVGDE